METEAFNHQRETNHHQEAQTENHYCRVLVDEIHQRFRGPQHDTDCDNHRDHHHRQVFNHANCSNHAVEREHGVQYHDLHNHHPEYRLNRIFLLGHRFGFQTLMQLHGALKQQEHTTE